MKYWYVYLLLYLQELQAGQCRFLNQSPPEHHFYVITYNWLYIYAGTLRLFPLDILFNWPSHKWRLLQWHIEPKLSTRVHECTNFNWPHFQKVWIMTIQTLPQFLLYIYVFRCVAGTLMYIGTRMLQLHIQKFGVSQRKIEINIKITDNYCVYIRYHVTKVR